MKFVICLAQFILFLEVGYAQHTAPLKKGMNPFAAVDKKALELPGSQSMSTQGIANYINASFSTDSDKARAIYIWVASNIEYDVANMFAINFYETSNDKIEKALRTKKGICENYAAVFNDIAHKCGLNAYVVQGYTKQNGFADYIPHAWYSAMLNGSWYLFDPTWGSGYMANAKFIKRIDNSYYKVSPRVFITAHMPFDPMWEFLNYTISNQEFYEGNVKEDKSKPYFSFTDSIARYEKLGLPDQNVAACRRIEANGVKNGLIYDRLAHLKHEVEIYNNQKQVDASNAKVERYNSALGDFNEGVNSYNTFIAYYNKQFKPSKPDEEIQAMFDSGYDKFIAAKKKLEQIDSPQEQLAGLITKFKKTIDDALAHAGEQKEWLNKYFSKGKFGRTSMFTKHTWMGIPLN